jgi:hypothetical protein
MLSHLNEEKEPLLIIISFVLIYPAVKYDVLIPLPVTPVFQLTPPSLDKNIPPLIIRTISLGLVKLVVVIPLSSQTTD